MKRRTCFRLLTILMGSGWNCALAGPATEDLLRFIKAWEGEGSEPDKFDMPIGIAIHDADELFITDHYNQRVQRFQGLK